MKNVNTFTAILFITTIILLCFNLLAYGESAIKLGYCAYGNWPKYASEWYKKHAKLIVTDEKRAKEINWIKKYDESILAFLYKFSLNKSSDSHGVAGYEWINKNHGGYIGNVEKENGVNKLKNNFGEKANFLDSKKTSKERKFIIEIDSAGVVDTSTFRFSMDGGSTWMRQRLATKKSKITLIDGVQIWFPDDIYQKGDKWSFIVQDCWFLLDKDGRRMTDQYSDYSKENVYWMDWGNLNWQRFWTDDVLKDLGDDVWDGVMADCAFVYISKYWAPYGVLQYRTNKQFNDAVESFYAYAYKKINRMGKMLLPNSNEAIDSWDERLAHTHGGLDEAFVNFCQWNKNVWRNEQQWEKQIRNLEKSCKEGKVYFAMAHNRGLNKQDLLFNLASFLIGTDGKHGYFYNAGIEGYRLEKYIRDYEEFKDIYELPIGKPLGKRYFEDGVWKRKYKNGLIIVNPFPMAKILLIDKDYVTQEGHSIKEINLVPHTGLLLINKSSLIEENENFTN